VGVWVREVLGSYFGQETGPCDRRFALFFKETAATSFLTQKFDYDCREEVYSYSMDVIIFTFEHNLMQY
jgi:hypothetical protein